MHKKHILMNTEPFLQISMNLNVQLNMKNFCLISQVIYSNCNTYNITIYRLQMI